MPDGAGRRMSKERNGGAYQVFSVQTRRLEGNISQLESCGIFDRSRTCNRILSIELSLIQQIFQRNPSPCLL